MSKQLVCSVCGHVDKSKTQTKGNLLIEIILWLSFIIPGIIYSIWRRSSLSPMCSACNSTNLIPLDTPVGQKLLAEQGKTAEEIQAVEKEELKKGIRLRVIIYGSILAIIFLPLLISFFTI